MSAIEALRAKLTPGPIDPEHGYMVDSKTPFAMLHRHFSHLFSASSKKGVRP